MKNFVIIDASEVANVDFDQVQETSTDTLRYSLDGTQTFVKFVGDTPSFLEGKLHHSEEEILSILASSEWKPDEI